MQGNAVVVVDVDVGHAALGKAAHHRSVAKVVHLEGVDLVVADQQQPLVGLTGRVVVVDHFSFSLSLALALALSRAADHVIVGPAEDVVDVEGASRNHDEGGSDAEDNAVHGPHHRPPAIIMTTPANASVVPATKATSAPRA